MKARYIVAAVALVFVGSVLRRGSYERGPNGGYVEKPGAFHTELVPQKSGEYRVYLTDTKFKNPTVANSEVKMWLGSGKEKIDFSCKAESDSFLCSTEAKIFEAGELTVLAKRDGRQGAETIYRFPLKHAKGRFFGRGRYNVKAADEIM